MKLSEELAEWRGERRARAAIDTAIFGPLAEKAAALETEVERLRDERDAFRKEADEAREQANAFSLDGMALDSELTAYRAAVAQLREYAMSAVPYSDAACGFVAILDKLPKDAP